MVISASPYDTKTWGSYLNRLLKYSRSVGLLRRKDGSKERSEVRRNHAMKVDQ